MSIDRFMDELGAALNVRGPARRRFLLECRDHLVDAASERDEQAAVRAFGTPSEIAAAFDEEVAAKRGIGATFATVVGVIATGGSTLALIHGSTANGPSAPWWPIAFFVGAQLAALAAGLALLQVLASRRSRISAPDQMLLARRNACAIVAAGVTMFSAAAALPGHASAVVLLGGPALACIALTAVLRARMLAARLAGARTRAARPPLQDLGRLAGIRVRPTDVRLLLAATTVLLTAAAFVRDRAENATVGAATVTAGIEATAVIACFLVLGGTLGLRSGRVPPHR